VGQAANELREVLRKQYQFALDVIFAEHASSKLLVKPDTAMELAEDLLYERVKKDVYEVTQNTSRPTAILRFDPAAIRREAHHYAVDQFYKTYFPRKRGAPPLPDSHIDRIIALRRKGLSRVATAEKLAVELGLRLDTAKYQVAAAEKRWGELLERIEQLKRKYPQ
jgi:hypothetical protein